MILGKTVTTEFANNHPSHDLNPHNPAHTPGGSSSGSAAAVADFMVPLALGTQTGGSTIRPAAYCGTFGCKPSFNSINRAGLKFVAESLDTVGILSRWAGDAAARRYRLSRAALPSPSGTRRASVCGARRAGARLMTSPARRSRSAAAALAKAGAQIADFEMPAGTERLFDEHGIIMHYEAARALAWEYSHHRELDQRHPDAAAGGRSGVSPAAPTMPHGSSPGIAGSGCSTRCGRSISW